MDIFGRYEKMQSDFAATASAITGEQEFSARICGAVETMHVAALIMATAGTIGIFALNAWGIGAGSVSSILQVATVAIGCLLCGAGALLLLFMMANISGLGAAYLYRKRRDRDVR